jgi:hypothetical protein
VSASKTFDAFLAAAKLPAIDDVDGWTALGELWRKHEHGDEDEITEAAKERIEGLEEENAELQEQIEQKTAECAAVREDAQEQRRERQTAGRERDDLRAINESLRKVIEKFTMTVPAILVRQVLCDIAARCEQKIPPDFGGDSGRACPEEKWHAVMRAIRNDAKRALAAMEPPA